VLAPTAVSRSKTTRYWLAWLLAITAGDIGTGKGVYIGLSNDHFSSEHAYLSVALVHHGDVVQPGALIGYSGNTGQSTGPHLHYAVMFDYDWVDPAQFWQGPVSEVVLFDGRRVPLPSEALAASGNLVAVDPVTVPAGGDNSYLLGGAMGQYFPSNPPPVPGDWAHRGIPYITGARGQEWTVVYARRLSDAENHGNLRLYGKVIGPDGRELTGVELRAFSDAGLEARTTTGPDGGYEFAGFGRGALQLRGGVEETGMSESLGSSSSPLILDDRRNRRDDGPHDGRGHATQLLDEPLSIHTAQLQRVHCGSLGQAVPTVRRDLHVPDVLRQVVLPFHQRGHQLDGQRTDGVRADDHDRARLPDLGPDRRVQVDQPDLAAPSSQESLPPASSAVPRPLARNALPSAPPARSSGAGARSAATA